MVKKRILILCAWTLMLLSLSGCLTKENRDSADESSGFYWDREKSHFVDYNIPDDTIQFQYEFCFVNNGVDDVKLSHLIATFKKSELKGWLKYEKCYEGVLEDGGHEIIVKAGETVNVVYTFSGEYLGGTVNVNLTIPDIVMGMDYE